MGAAAMSARNSKAVETETDAPKYCAIDDPHCEACQ
jgi:hypothetical protein